MSDPAAQSPVGGMSLAASDRLGPYEILAPLGAGGMGEVYRARDTRLGREVAIKVISDRVVGDPQSLRRFEHEAKAVAALSHPNILAIHDFSTENGISFVVMELLRGESLEERLAREHLSWRKAVEIAAAVADGLASAHGQGIIHRDLKPANIFLTRDGQVKILDFGLAKRYSAIGSGAGSDVETETQPGLVVGTIGYMSPEQVSGAEIDARSDIFALGCILYEMISGERAFVRPSAGETLAAILRDNPRDLSESGRAFPPAIAHIVRRCLLKNADERFQSARDLAFELRMISTDAPREAKSRSRAAALAGIGAVAIVIAVVAALNQWRPAGAKRPSSTSTNSARQTTIAVLPFANVGSSRDRDYLQLALPDELITILSHSRSLAVRPFVMTRKFTGDIDPQQTGHTLNVADVITGHFRDSGRRITVTLEAVDVEKNDVVWHDSLEVAAEDLIALRNELSTRIRSGLLPLLHASAEHGETNRPANDEAYSLFLRASAMPTDPESNKQALAMLERAVQLDPSYAPGWVAMSDRSYRFAIWDAGGDAALQRAEISASRALSIDPDLIVAAKRLVAMRTDRGDLQEAYRQATELVRRRPDSGDAHYTLGYVLRYAGLVGESAHECEQARSLDPTNTGFRSCALTFALLDDQQRAAEFAGPDIGYLMYSLLRAGRREEALRLGRERNPNRWWWPLLEAYSSHRPPEQIEAAAAQSKQRVLSVPDSGPLYFSAEVFAVCQRPDDALELLRRAVEKNYCAYPAMDHDPTFAQIRGTPEFRNIRQMAIDHQQQFFRFRAAITP